MTVTKLAWGSVDGEGVDLYTLDDGSGIVARVATYGATLVGLFVPDRSGVPDDVVLGHDELAPYVETPRYFGATVGRVGNRIAGARFELDGHPYELAANQAPHHLHGGVRGWDKRVWAADPVEDGVRLTLESPDGDAGYPGGVVATTTYRLTDPGTLTIEMTAITDRPTIVNMVHHSYFNLTGSPVADVLGHQLRLHAAAWTPGMPPDGGVADVAGTPFDFRIAKPVGRDLEAAGSPGGGAPAGYDGNWIVDGPPRELRPVASLHDPQSGRTMAVRANQPGVQFYSGVFLDGTTHGKGRSHGPASGLCLETQAFPNAINVPAWRDQVILRPGQTYRHLMELAFSAE